MYFAVELGSSDRLNMAGKAGHPFINSLSDRLNMAGEAGHPCLEPRPMLKRSESCPTVTTRAQGFEHKTYIWTCWFVWTEFEFFQNSPQISPLQAIKSFLCIKK